MALNVDVSLDQVSGAGDKLERGIRSWLETGADRGFAVSQEHVPEDRSTLLYSGFEPEWERGRLQWGYRAGHAWPVEEGTGPFYPPLQPLLEWSQRVTGDVGLGFYVARVKIPEEGIDAQPYASVGRDAQQSWYQSNSASDFIDREMDT